MLMSDNFEKIDKIELSDESTELVIGGATIDVLIRDKEFLETSVTQKCNCEKFEPHSSKTVLNICDNCKHARSPELYSSVAYCVKQDKFGQLL